MTNKTELMQEFEDIARYQGAIDFERKDDFTNEILPFPATYFNYTTEIAWRVFANTSKQNATIEQLRSEIESLKKENAEMKDAIEHLGNVSDICTKRYTKNVCANCKCQE